jgi:ubiquinol-cytochrome c reductase cytochrome b subunit
MIGPLLAARMPRNVGLGHVLGSCLLAAILLQVVTGMLMSLYYSPSPDSAYESVRYLEEEIGAGKMIRGLHHWGASATVVLAILHLTVTFVRGAYKGPRRWTWVSGVALLAIVLGFGFTGYLLPWDLKAYFGLQVGAHVPALVPGIGDAMTAMLLGGPRVEPWTLQRIFAIHAIVLPAALGLMLVVHVVQIARRGLAGEPGERTFHPDLLPKIAGAVALLVLALTGLAFWAPAPLEPKADPSNTTYNAHPEWYYFGLQQLLRLSWPAEVVRAIVVPGGLMLLILLAPWIDRRAETDWRKRPVAMGLCGAILAGWIGMTLWGYLSWRAAEGKLPTADGAAPEDLSWVGDPQRIERGERLYQDLNCHLCHAPDYPGLGRGINVPCELGSAGDRLLPSWTVAYLMEPYRIRWEERDKRPVMRMPHYYLSRDEAKDLAAYLSTNHAPDRVPPSGIDWAASRPDLEQRGAELFSKLQCGECHRISAAGYNAGPDLTHVGSKLTPDYLFAIVRDAPKVIPGTPMKDYAEQPRDDIEALVRYLRTLRGGR